MSIFDRIRSFLSSDAPSESTGMLIEREDLKEIIQLAERTPFKIHGGNQNKGDTAGFIAHYETVTVVIPVPSYRGIKPCIEIITVNDGHEMRQKLFAEKAILQYSDDLSLGLQSFFRGPHEKQFGFSISPEQFKREMQCEPLERLPDVSLESELKAEADRAPRNSAGLTWGEEEARRHSGMGVGHTDSSIGRAFRQHCDNVKAMTESAETVALACRMYIHSAFEQQKPTGTVTEEKRDALIRGAIGLGHANGFVAPIQTWEREADFLLKRTNYSNATQEERRPEVRGI